MVYFFLAHSDQCWGIISRRICSQSDLQDPTDVIAAIHDELTKPSIRDWIGPSTTVNVRKLNCTRNWKDHVSGTGVKLEGGLLRDDEGNHMFLAMQRRGEGLGCSKKKNRVN